MQSDHLKSQTASSSLYNYVSLPAAGTSLGCWTEGEQQGPWPDGGEFQHLTLSMNLLKTLRFAFVSLCFVSALYQIGGTPSHSKYRSWFWVLGWTLFLICSSIENVGLPVRYPLSYVSNLDIVVWFARCSLVKCCSVLGQTLCVPGI